MKKLCEVEVEGEEERKEGDWKIFQISKESKFNWLIGSSQYLSKVSIFIEGGVRVNC